MSFGKVACKVMDIKQSPNLENDLHSSRMICDKMYHPDFATDVYRALCNNTWIKPPDDNLDYMAEIMRGGMFKWHCSWRYAGGIVAHIRNTYYNAKEDYMDYYCQGREGEVTSQVREAFADIGWIISPDNR